MNDDEVRKAVRNAAPDGKAACRSLLELADRLGVEPARIGAACNELGVRICACQLGCFR